MKQNKPQINNIQAAEHTTPPHFTKDRMMKEKKDNKDTTHIDLIHRDVLAKAKKAFDEYKAKFPPKKED